MNKIGLPIALLVAGSLLVPTGAFSQGVDTAESPTAATVEMASAAGTAGAMESFELLRPTAGAAALLGPRQAHTASWEVSAADQIEVDVDDDGNEGGVPYMIAGGILFVAGAIAGGDAGTILMLGGAATGAYGAFVYFGGD